MELRGALQDNYRELLTWFINPQSKGLEVCDGPHAPRMFARLIATQYRSMSGEAVRGGGKPVEIEVPAIVASEYAQGPDRDYLAPVLRLKQLVSSRLREQLKACLLISSLATLDYSKGWSDCDVFVVIRETCVLDPDQLSLLRNTLIEASSLLTQIDVFQHHGFMCCTERDLIMYRNDLMPLDVLRQGKSLLGDARIQLCVSDDVRCAKTRFVKSVDYFSEVCRRGVLEHHAYRGEYLLDNFKNASNAMYQLKNFIQYVSIMPCYFLQAMGESCCKRESYARAKVRAQKVNWELVDACSRIRSLWPQMETHPYLGNEVPQWVRNELGGHYFDRAYQLLSALLPIVQEVV